MGISSSKDIDNQHCSCCSLLNTTFLSSNELKKNSLNKVAEIIKKKTDIETQSPDDRNKLLKLASDIHVPKVDLNDFTLLRVLGRGGFGKVFLVEKKIDKKIYAMKAIKKSKIFKTNQINIPINEKNIMIRARHPFVVRLKYSFQDTASLYLVMEYLPGGDLFHHLRNRGKFNEDITRFYVAEVLLALEFLHMNLNVIYRDLKLENILMDSEGHVKLTDFGLAKMADTSFTFCGTAEYLAPEMLKGGGHNKDIDWWGLGCLIYEMLAGTPPFHGENMRSLFEEILKQKIEFPEDFSQDAKDLISHLLSSNPKERLGAKSVKQIKDHPFFKTINWKDLFEKKYEPPVKPKLRNNEDFRYFDPEVVNEPVINSPEDPGIDLNSERREVEAFTYVEINDKASY